MLTVFYSLYNFFYHILKNYIIVNVIMQKKFLSFLKVEGLIKVFKIPMARENHSS